MEYSLEDFAIKERLGKNRSGYFGIRAAVFRAQRQQVDYALKIMTYDRIDLYEQEYGTLLKLESHPNVIKVHGVIKLDKFDKKIEEQLKELSCDEISSLRSLPYVLIVIMDYYQYNFEEFVNKMPRPLAESIAVQILIQIFEGLKHLIRNNIVHRDLKPDNILLSYGTIEGNNIKGLRVVLTDFGTHLTKLTLDTTNPVDKALLKIPKGAEYLRAPEAWPPKSKSTVPDLLFDLKAIVDYRKSDIWAIGRICYQLFSSSGGDLLPRKFSCSIPEELPYLENVRYSERFRNLAQSLLLKDPNIRPDIDHILSILHDMALVDGE